jgi:hypothetical protein
MDTTLWRATVRPASRYEECTLLVQGRTEQVEVKLQPPRAKVVHYESENRRIATFGILIDHGCIAFMMLGKSGRWSTTGFIAKRQSALIPFVALPLLGAELLDITEVPEVPCLYREDVIAKLND